MCGGVQVSSEIRRELIKRAASFHLKLADISITCARSPGPALQPGEATTTI